MPLKEIRRVIAEAGYPETYRQQELALIIRAVRARQSVLVCGLGGSGKSHLLRFLAFHAALPAMVGPQPLLRVYLDCNAAITSSAANLFRSLLLESGATTEIPSDPADALPALRAALAEQMAPGARYLIVLDRFERIPAAAHGGAGLGRNTGRRAPTARRLAGP